MRGIKPQPLVIKAICTQISIAAGMQLLRMEKMASAPYFVVLPEHRKEDCAVYCLAERPQVCILVDEVPFDVRNSALVLVCQSLEHGVTQIDVLALATSTLVNQFADNSLAIQ